ncbi:MAG: DUF3604 domain-containing protein, partial [Lentisphaerota bacterium]
MPGKYTLEKWTNMQAQLRLAGAVFTNLIIFPSFEYTKTGASFPTNWVIPQGTGHKNFYCYDLDHIPGLPIGMDMMDSCLDAWAYLNAQPSAGHWMCAPHHSSKGSEPAEAGEYHDPFISMAADWSTQYVNEVYQPFVEIYSRHGSSEMPACEEPVNNPRSEATVSAALDRWFEAFNPGYKLGIIGSTDTHFGDPGWTVEDAANVQQWLGFYTGGLAATITTNRSRAEIWGALRGRHCYGTSGERILLEFTAKMGTNLAGMGDTIFHTNSLNAGSTAQVNLHLWAEDPRGSNTIARLEIFRNSTLIATAMTNALTARFDFTDELTNSFAYYRAKVWMNFPTLNPACQYERAWSSPIWIEQRSASSGNLQVVIQPEEARLSGARWRVAGGDWMQSGEIVNGLPAGDWQLDFNAITNGGVPPGARRIHIADGQTTITNLDYITSPVILVQPSSQEKYSGESASFRVWAGGRIPLTCQWRRPVGGAIAGATNAAYVIAPVTTADDNTFYRCVISNGMGVVTSETARLDVTDQAPLIKAPPGSSTNDAGTAVFLNVGAEGSQPLSYQWQHDGVVLSGATQLDFAISRIMATNIGAYRCFVSNSLGVTATSNAWLAVRPVAYPQNLYTMKNHGLDLTLGCLFGATTEYSIVRQPAWAALTNITWPVLRYQPLPEVLGTDTFVYAVSANGLTNQANINWEIVPEGVDLVAAISGPTNDLPWGQGNLLYVITITNKGSTSALSAAVEGTLDANSLYARSDVGDAPDGVLHASLGDLAVGGSVRFGLETTPMQTGLVIQVMLASNLLADVYPANNTVALTNRVVQGYSSQSNGIPDWWAERYFTNAAWCVATGDADHDLSINLDEFLAGTNPQDAGSRLEIANAHSVDGKILAFHFLGQSGRVYRAESAGAMESNSWTENSGSLPGAGNDVVILFTNQTPARFHRVRTP